MTIQTTGTAVPPDLQAQMAAVEAEFPRWHVFADDGGTINAVRNNTLAEMRAIERRLAAGLFAASGITLHAATPALIRTEIASYLRAVRSAA